ncbi:MAG: hypothetical protein ACFFAO_19510 [Candidatus Hermodarchaeota archaeon]
MNISFEHLIKESVLSDLSWFQEEFDFLFKLDKNQFSENELKVGTKIIEYLTKVVNVNDGEILLNSLSLVLSNIENRFPDFF